MLDVLHRAGAIEGDDGGTFRGWRYPLAVAWHKPLRRGSLWTLASTFEPRNIASGKGYYGVIRSSWARPMSASSRVGFGFMVVAPGLDPRFRDGDMDDVAEDWVDQAGLPETPLLIFPYLSIWWRGSST